jgi:hypothetical protein
MVMQSARRCKVEFTVVGVLDELADIHLEAGAGSPQGQAQGRSGLALAISGVYLHETLHGIHLPNGGCNSERGLHGQFALFRPNNQRWRDPEPDGKL